MIDKEIITPANGSKIVTRESELYILMRSFFQLTYSLCKQYISWYEQEIKNKV